MIPSHLDEVWSDAIVAELEEAESEIPLRWLVSESLNVNREELGECVGLASAGEISALDD